MKDRSSVRESRIAFAEFLDGARGHAAELGVARGQPVWYRGQSNQNYKLQPSLFRSSVVSHLADAAAHEGYLGRLESDLFFEFQAQALNLENGSIDSWDLLFLMRHYGLPTRTLDWSEIIGVAVYFALHPDDPKELAGPTIWLLNPAKLNGCACGCGDSIVPRNLGFWLWGKDSDRDEETRRKYDEWKRGVKDSLGVSVHQLDYADLLSSYLHTKFRTKVPLAVYPSRRNERMLAQQGCFTMHVQGRDALEELCPEAVRKLVIPDSAVEGARLFLEESGTNPRVIFPGLDGLSREMRAKYSPTGRSVATA